MVAYLDDICVIGKSKGQALEHGQEVTRHLQKSWFHSQSEENMLSAEAVSRVSWTHSGHEGDEIGSSRRKDKAHKKRLQKDITLRGLARRKLAATIGLLNSVCRALRNGRLMTRYLLGDVGRPSNRTMSGTTGKSGSRKKTKAELIWWIEHMDQFNGRPLITPTHSKELWTDASGMGWGAVCGKEDSSRGMGREEEKMFTSNQRESLAILRGLEAFRNQLRGHVVKIHSDNMTAVSNVGHRMRYAIQGLFWK